MPASVIAMIVIGLLSVLWPGPKLDHRPPPSGGVFAPPSDLYEVASKKPDVTIGESTATWK